MIDPRRAIKALFTNGLISSYMDPSDTTSRLATVGVTLREDNLESKAPTGSVGVVVLEPVPTETVTTISIGGKTVMEQATIMANIWVTRQAEMLQPEAFMNSIINSFENEVIDHHTDIDATTKDIWPTGIITVPSDSPLLMRKAVMLTAVGYKIRP